MNGTGVYPDNNTSYSQSDATSTFTWSTQDGPAIVGQSVTHTYTTEGAYIVQLEIEDVQGCSNANDIDQEIRVSTTPHFTGTAGSPDPICLGEQAVFNGLVTPVTYEKTCDQPNFPPISLPDGSEFLIKQVLISIAMEHLNLLPTLVILYLYVLILNILIWEIWISLLNVQTGRLFL